MTELSRGLQAATLQFKQGRQGGPSDLQAMSHTPPSAAPKHAELTPLARAVADAAAEAIVERHAGVFQVTLVHTTLLSSPAEPTGWGGAAS